MRVEIKKGQATFKRLLAKIKGITVPKATSFDPSEISGIKPDMKISDKDCSEQISMMGKP